MLKAILGVFCRRTNHLCGSRRWLVIV